MNAFCPVPSAGSAESPENPPDLHIIDREIAGELSNWQGIKPESLPCGRPNGYAADETIYIVTPTRNVAATIDQTIQTVVQQSGRFKIRYHVQDGCSTDGTLNKLEEWDRRLKSGQCPVYCGGIEFTFASGKDASSYDAVQKAFALLNVPDGAFMTWLGGDDLLATGALATVHDVSLHLPKVSWLSGGVCVLNTDFVQCGTMSLNIFPREVVRAGLCDLRRWPCLQQEGTFWRGHLWRAVGGLDTSLTLAADYDLWRRFAEHEILYMFRGVLGYFKVRKGQLSSDRISYAAEIARICPERERDRQWAVIRDSILQNSLHVYELQKVESANAMQVFRKSRLFAQLPYQAMRIDPELCKIQALRYATLLSNKVGARNALAAARVPGVPVTENRIGSPVFPAGSDIQDAAYQPPPADSAAQGQLRPLWMPHIHRQRKSLGRRLRHLKWCWVIRKSGLFFESFYLLRNPDVRKRDANPLYHFAACGAWEGRNPNPAFDVDYYLSMYPDVLETGLNPLVHFILFGEAEDRKPNPYFSTADYRAGHPEAAGNGYGPLRHYLEFGLPAGRVAPPAWQIKAAAAAPNPSSSAPAAASSAIQSRAETAKTHAPAQLQIAAPSDPSPRKDPALKTGGPLFPEDFAYARKSHFEKMSPMAIEVHGQKQEPGSAHLKTYQDLLVYTFLRDRVPPGSRILDVGGGNSRILRRLSTTYECWNVDKFEGVGNGPTDMEKFKSFGYRVVSAFMGDFCPELPDNYFDFVFSVSALEHTPQGQPELYPRIVQDIERVSKNGAWTLHLFDVILRGDSIWASDCMYAFFKCRTTVAPMPDVNALINDPDLHCECQEMYERYWQRFTNEPYETFGRPSNIAVLWQVKK